MPKSPESTDLVERVETVAEYQPGTDWYAATAQADETEGYDLAKELVLDSLVGIPFLITALTFRPGETRWVSVECVLAPESEMVRRKIAIEDLPFSPGDQVVFNDSGTGIYRQLAAYCEARGYMTAPKDMPSEGARGESRYDLPFTQWDIVAGDVRASRDGRLTWRVPVRLLCKRGIRLSEYSIEGVPGESKTRYLA